MSTRRGSSRIAEREELVAYIHGIDSHGDMAHILVHKRGSNIRFSGKLGAHTIATSKSADLDQWVHEAQAVWGLDDIIGVPRSWMNTPETLERIAAMNTRAVERKKNLEAAPPDFQL